MSKEFEIIKKYFLPLTNNSKASQGLKDDVALITTNPKKQLVVSKDLSIEDIHFTKSQGGELIARKLLASNLSDLASSGAKPLYYLLGFSQNNFDEKFIADFCIGLKKSGKEFGLDLIGGDSVKVTDKLCFSVTIFGEVLKGKSLKRSTAKDGDLIFVSGNIGDSFLGLQILQNQISGINSKDMKYLIDRHLLPTPRIGLGEELIKNNIKCAIDVSDGLFADLKHICEASNLSAVINQNLIPISKAAKSCLDKNNQFELNKLFCGGEDYELIFTAPKNQQNKIAKIAQKLNLKITQIGNLQKTKAKPEIQLLNKQGEKIEIKQYGWQHY